MNRSRYPLPPAWPQVESVTRVQKRHKLVSREAHPQNSTVTTRGVIMAGPCSVESEQQLMTTAEAVAKAGATVLRCGAFMLRTSPYEFQGLGEKGLKLFAKARKATSLPVITELLTFRTPFPGDSADEVLRRQLDRAEFIPPRELNADIPAALEHLILRCLEKDMEKRYPSSSRLVHELKQALLSLRLRSAGTSLTPPPPGTSGSRRGTAGRSAS